jgi:hypothetical protein
MPDSTLDRDLLMRPFWENKKNSTGGISTLASIKIRDPLANSMAVPPSPGGGFPGLNQIDQEPFERHHSPHSLPGYLRRRYTVQGTRCTAEHSTTLTAFPCTVRHPPLTVPVPTRYGYRGLGGLFQNEETKRDRKPLRPPHPLPKADYRAASSSFLYF